MGENVYLTIYIQDNLHQDILIKWDRKEKYKPFMFREMNKSILSLIFTTTEENKKLFDVLKKRKREPNIFYSLKFIFGTKSTSIYQHERIIELFSFESVRHQSEKKLKATQITRDITMKLWTAGKKYKKMHIEPDYRISYINIISDSVNW